MKGTGSDPQLRLLLSYAQAADALGISERMLRQLVYSARLPSVSVGSRRLIAVDDLMAFVSALREASPL